MAYGSDAAMIAYLALTGRAVHPSHDVATARQYGSMYVDQFEQMYRGVAATLDASFPRDLWPTVPTRVEHAAYEAGLAWSEGVAIFGGGGTSGGQVTSEQIDTLKVTYAEPKDGGYWESNMFILPIAYSLLLPFFKRAGGGNYAAFVV